MQTTLDSASAAIETGPEALAVFLRHCCTEQIDYLFDEGRVDWPAWAWEAIEDEGRIRGLWS